MSTPRETSPACGSRRRPGTASTKPPPRRPGPSPSIRRGFDADHGTDLALSIDGVPINLVSHAHGQGFADTNFLIPEVVERVEITKGPYFAHQGDFATAGAVNMVSRDEFEHSSAGVGLV